MKMLCENLYNSELPHFRQIPQLSLDDVLRAITSFRNITCITLGQTSQNFLRTFVGVSFSFVITRPEEEKGMKMSKRLA